MNISSDLLVVARRLVVTSEEQASLRRGVSTAYYALFHRLIEDACVVLVDGPDEELGSTRTKLARCFTHSQMRSACHELVGGKSVWLPERTQNARTLTLIADMFLALQQARQEADYSRTRVFTQGEASLFVWDADLATDFCKLVFGSPEQKAFAISLLLKARTTPNAFR